MNDRRPGMYYVPNEGMRYWDGESWSRSEPLRDDSERSKSPEAAEEASMGRRARRKGILPWVVAGIAVIAAGAMAALLVIGGGASGALAFATGTPDSAKDVSSPAASKSAAPATKKKSSRPASTTSVSPRAIAPTAKKQSRPPATKAAPTKAPKPVSTFDDDYARLMTGRIVEDIATADERMLDRPLNAGNTMGFLSDTMSNLEGAGVPDVKDQVHYVALLRTLGQFYDKAEWQLSEDQITEAAATYTVARKATSELLTILNPVLGTKHKLPVWSWM